MTKPHTIRPTTLAIIIYALGQFGWSLAAFGATNLLVYFYMPPESGGESAFPTFIYQGAILGFIAVLGIVNFGGRLFDAITDPLIANWSDKMQSGFGKRKFLMAISAVPFALFSFLIFYPISASININTGWLLLGVFFLYFFMTLYVVPYTALISELGHHPDDRLKISTIISVTWALGFIIGNAVYAFQANFEATMNSTAAFQTVIGIYAIISLVFMLIPVFFLNENKYAVQVDSSYDLKKSISSVFANANFRYFIFSDLMYWLALTFIQLGVSFYITLLFGMEKEQATTFMTIGFMASFLLYVPLNFLSKKFGKKRMLMVAFLVFSLVFAITFLVPMLPISKDILFYVLAVTSAFPLAAFGIIPNAIIADVVHADAVRTGTQQAGMFYAVRNFMMKLGASIANLIFPSLLLLGRSLENPLGVKISAILAFVFCLIGFFIFTKYNEE